MTISDAARVAEDSSMKRPLARRQRTVGPTTIVIQGAAKEQPNTKSMITQ